jgi:short subunit dehydrogenase-like uncharacterized protein
MSQAGLSLALDQDRLPDRAGVLTPATAAFRPRTVPVSRRPMRH